jgi:uncharacterized 2Fe-2S/4Fe-4S cluster protein (DUF4445 family)
LNRISLHHPCQKQYRHDIPKKKTNRIRKDVVEVTKRMTNFELSETLSFMNNYMAALFLPHTNMEQFPKIKARLEVRKDLQKRNILNPDMVS